MDKNQLKAAITKEFLVIIVFTLAGIAGYLLLPYLYNYYVHHFPTRSNASYVIVLRGWWFMIVIGYFLSLFTRRS